MTAILGITDGDDAGAALLVDGVLVAAVNEERLNRLKMSIGFPRESVREVLSLAGIKAGDVDRVAVAAYSESFSAESRPNKGWFQGDTSALVRVRNDVAALLAKPLGGFPLARRAYAQIKKLTRAGRRSAIRKLLAEEGITAPISYHEHHRCHAIAAYCASGFDEALSLSLDGGGDGRSSHVFSIDGEGERLVNELDSFDSLGNYYAYVTHLCGYRATIHEGKITGLAASGKPIYKPLFEQLIAYEDGQIRNVGKLFFTEAIQAFRALLPSDWEHSDLASSVQAHLEDIGTKYVRYWLQKTGQRNICLSGGVFANVVLNQRIAELPECDAVYVFPAMGDGGLAAGAAYSEMRALPEDSGGMRRAPAVPHVYLGRAFSDTEIEAAIRESGQDFQRYDDIESVIAQLVHDGKVVARFNGAMEYGPRALGNRTIIYRTTEKSVNDWLNRRLNRTEFMPFAPACLPGQEDKLFRWNPASAMAARYMTITLDCTEWMTEHCPAVVHIDGTARPQIVDPETNPSFHRVIERYHELSGIPVVVNTSFNMHEEPIVCTPDDAIRSYGAGKLDNLAIGPFLLGAPPVSSA